MYAVLFLLMGQAEGLKRIIDHNGQQKKLLVPAENSSVCSTLTVKTNVWSVGGRIEIDTKLGSLNLKGEVPASQNIFFPTRNCML